MKEARIDDSSYAAENARLQARMAYWTKESAHVKDQNAPKAKQPVSERAEGMAAVVPGLRLHWPMRSETVKMYARGIGSQIPTCSFGTRLGCRLLTARQAPSTARPSSAG